MTAIHRAVITELTDVHYLKILKVRAPYDIIQMVSVTFRPTIF